MPVTLEAELFPYAVDEVREVYTRTSGFIVQPVGYSPLGGNAAAVKTRTSAPQVQRVVTWSLQRLGKPCEYPAAAAEREGEVELVRTFVPHAPKEMPGGVRLFTLEGAVTFQRLDGQFPVGYPDSLTFTPPPEELGRISPGV